MTGVRCGTSAVPEPRPKGDLKGTKPTGRTRLLGPGGKRIAPTEPTPEAPPWPPAASTPPAAPGRPPWDNGGLHVGGCGGQFKNLAVGASAGRRCKACGEEWRWMRVERRWERVE